MRNLWNALLQFFGHYNKNPPSIEKKIFFLAKVMIGRVSRKYFCTFENGNKKFSDSSRNTFVATALSSCIWFLCHEQPVIHINSQYIICIFFFVTMDDHSVYTYERERKSCYRFEKLEFFFLLFQFDVFRVSIREIKHLSISFFSPI